DRQLGHFLSFLFAEIKRRTVCPVFKQPTSHGGSKMRIDQFTAYCKEEFSIRQREQKVRDQRKQPIIPTATIVKAVREMVVLGQSSLLEYNTPQNSDHFDT
ncbi:MAG: hypothetical protein ACE5G1_12295, partial [bacterium]